MASRESPGRRVAHVLDPVEEWAALDRVASPLRAAVAALTAGPRLRNLLSGVPLGHPVHPALAQLTVGCFLGAGLLDLRGRRSDRAASSTLIAAGVTSALPTALTGLTDWSHGHEQQQRTGLVHAAGNSTALALYAATLLRRRRGGSGRLLSVAALTVSGAAAYLGGHLAFRQALGPNHAEHVPHRVPPGWSSLGPLDDLPERTLVPRTLGDQPLVAYRDGNGVTVLSDVCPHLSGPLHEGDVRDGCVTCPWHGSSFRLADGEPVAGPATAPVPTFEVRLEGGQIRVLLPGAG
jgi:nitrite reductase/ring-hydroxylating ferredoxin subunit/uncharacterized membrane protein